MSLFLFIIILRIWDCLILQVLSNIPNLIYTYAYTRISKYVRLEEQN